MSRTGYPTSTFAAGPGTLRLRALDGQPTRMLLLGGAPLPGTRLRPRG